MVDSPPTIQFLGTGPYLLFSLGVAKYLREHYNTDHFTVLASSGGAIAALAFLTLSVNKFDLVARELAQLFGSLRYEKWPLFSIARLYHNTLESLVQPTSLPLLQDRLQIATTTLPFFQRKRRRGPYRDTIEVVSLLESSAYIPTYFHKPPPRLEVDGGLSRGNTDPRYSLIVSPRRKSYVDIFMPNQHLNFLRILSATENLALYEQGYHCASSSTAIIEAKLAAHKKLFYASR